MRVTVNDVAIFFEVIGEKLALRDGVLVEKPTLLVLHGGPGFDHSGMRGYFDRFADVAQVVYLDHRANGRSDHGPRSGWNLDQWGDDVAALRRSRSGILWSSDTRSAGSWLSRTWCATPSTPPR